MDEYNNNKTELQKPLDQLDLTDAEKNKEHTRILTATNPHAPHNIVRFAFKDAEFKQTAAVDQLAIHFSLNGNLIHVDGDEARRQKQKHERARRMQEKRQRAHGSDSESDSEPDEADAGVQADLGNTVLRNQFNFSERGAQTFNNPYRHREEQTEPPPRADFSGTVNQWEIFDAYQADVAKQQREKEKQQKKGGRRDNDDRSVLLAKKKAALELERQLNTTSDDLTKISRASKIIERMVNQNTHTDISEDYKYFEDESDTFRENGRGTLLPLWRFSYEGTKKLSATDICWSQHYKDLFAVSYGSFNFAKQIGGALIFYSLKNPSYPEYIFETEAGIMSIDIHPTHGHYICAGLYNGDVAVFNLKSKSKKPEFVSSSVSGGKHTDPVWQVKWQPENLDSHMNFCSISGDGRVVNWVLVKNELMHTDVVCLKNVEDLSQLDDPLNNLTLASGVSFAFHPEQNNLFLAGTEEGKVYKCSQTYTSRYLDMIKAHHMTVEAIKWSPFHSNIFMTCSQDWSLKIWDHNFPKQPLFVFELGAAVGSCAWAYHSSTVFAAVTNDGKIHIFDISTNKYEALASQVVVQKKKTKLTSVQFNKTDPILILGDDRGYITTVKLSPNLRKLPKLKKGQVYKLDVEAEKEKLENIAELVRTK